MRSSQVVPNQPGTPAQYNGLRQDAHGSSFLLTQQMLGYFSLANQPADGDTITFDVNGTNIVLTAKTTLGTTPGQVKIGGSAAAFVANCLALLQQPQTTTSTGIALAAANQQLLGYLSFAAPSGGTTLYVLNSNNNLYAPLSSFTGSTTTSGNSWNSQTMRLYVHAGTVYVNGTRILWGGGSTPTVTAPSSNPRIDVLTIDNTATLAWTTGTEASSPTAPSYPADKVAICELYNVVSETALYDTEYKQSNEGYIYNDVRPFLGERMNWAAFPADFIPDADGTRNLGSSGKEWNNLYVKSAIFLNGQAISAQMLYAATAAENIAASAALAAGYYHSDGGIQVSSAGTATPTGSSGAYSVSLSIGSGLTNSVLVVLIRYRANVGTVASLQWNGTGMTSVGLADPGSSAGHIYGAYLVAPSSGTHNLTWTASGNGSDVVCVSYWVLTNAAQTGTIDSSASFGSPTSGTPTATLTPNNVGAFVIAYTGSSSSSVGTALSWENAATWSGTGIAGVSGDANKAFPLVPITVGTTGSGGGLCGLIAIKPFTTAVLGAVVNASSSNTAAAFADNFSGYRSSAFIGFAAASAVPGAAMNVVVGGAAGGLSALISGAQYYLADTGGAIANVAGTVSRKIGIAVSATQLLITNLW